MSEERSDERCWRELPLQLPAIGTTRAFTVESHDLLLCNVEGRPYVVAARCSHAKASLAGGRLNGHELECPLHGGKLDVRDGSPLQQPIRKALASFPVREHEGRMEFSLQSVGQPIQKETNDA